MNHSQALKEARRRWGKIAAVRSYGDTRTVGRIVMGMMFEVKGQGKTWALAFAQHDRGLECEQIFRAAVGQPCPRCSWTISERHFSRDVHDPEEPAPVLDDVICRSCWLNTKLPAAVHGWSEDRRSGLYLLGAPLGQWLSYLASGDVVGFARADKMLPPYVEAALIGHERMIAKHRAARAKRRNAK